MHPILKQIYKFNWHFHCCATHFTLRSTFCFLVASISLDIDLVIPHVLAAQNTLGNCGQHWFPKANCPLKSFRSKSKSFLNPAIFPLVKFPPHKNKIVILMCQTPKKTNCAVCHHKRNGSPVSLSYTSWLRLPKLIFHHHQWHQVPS